MGLTEKGPKGPASLSERPWDWEMYPIAGREKEFGVTTDPTNATRQARHRKARALGYEHVAGYLPPKRAAKVRQWLAEAERLMETDEARVVDAPE